MFVLFELICHLKIIIHDFLELGNLLQINILSILTKSERCLHLHLLNAVFQ